MPSARRHLAALGSCRSSRTGLSAGGASVVSVRFECAIILVVGHGLGVPNTSIKFQSLGSFRGFVLYGLIVAVPVLPVAQSQHDHCIIIPCVREPSTRQRRWLLQRSPAATIPRNHSRK